LRKVVAAGSEAGVSMAPVLPGISDKPEMLAAVVRAARDAGATHLWCGALHLRPGTREHFMENLARDWPEQLPAYKLLYQRDYLSKAVSEPIQATVREFERIYDVGDHRESPIVPEPAEEQLSLF
jgi:DNA repair photolyase